jgi:hypothetical protein
MLRLAATLALASALLDSDAHRARTKKPRDAYQGAGTLVSANAKLNGHLLARAGLNTTACEALSISQLQATLRSLFRMRSEELTALYPKSDGRASKFATEADLQAHWDQLAHDVDDRQRDGFCHEAVMWFVHHLTTPAQAEFAKTVTLPLLPTRQHVAAEDAASQEYASKVTCQRCHVGGIDNLHVPEIKPDTPAALARRCYTNYKDLFNVTCGPCDGISGIYTGDEDQYFTAPACQVVSLPENVPESERVKPTLPHAFTVDVTGSDRFGRTTNPSHSNIIAKTYGQIYGKWYMNVQPGADQWFLRHDTTYTSISVDGHAVPFLHQASVSEIHVQSTSQKKANVTGQMVSLIKGLPSWMPGGCTCIPDPVGVPDITTTEANGLANMEYMGRVKIDVEYGNGWIELDHWANWFFHIFMETDTSAPMYGKAPKRLASAYAGMAVYSNWTLGDPKVLRPDVWYGGIPTTPEKVGPDHGKFCMNPKKVPQCGNISQATFPPPPDAPGRGPLAAKGLLAPAFFPMKPEMDDAVHQALTTQNVLI